MEYTDKIFISNKLIRGLEGVDGERSLFYLTENRLLFLLLSQINGDDTEFEPLELSIADYCRFYQISNGGKVKTQIAEAIEFLKNTIFTVDGDPIKFLDDISDLEKSKMFLLMDDTLKSYLLNLKGNFTAFEIGFTADFKSLYAQKAYLYLHTYMNSPVPCRLGIEKACQVFSGGYYTKPGELTSFVLKKAIAEINENSDITVSYRQKCALGGKPEFIFNIHKKSEESLADIRYYWPDFYTTKDGSGIDYERVKEIDIIGYLEEYHPTLILYKNYEHISPSHDSLKFYKNRYHQFSRSEGGDLVDYLHKFGDMSKAEIKAELESTDYGCGIVRTHTKKEAKKLKVPKRCDVNLPVVKRYLEERGIDAAVINDFINEGLLYADVFKNCIFCNEGKIYILRATSKDAVLPKTTSVLAENNYFLHNYGGEFADKIYVFESAIDLMSFLDYNQEPGYYVAMAGLKDGALEKVEVKLNGNNDKEIVLCVDWDKAGEAFAAKHDQYECYPRPEGYEHCKDWNEILFTFKNSY